MGFNDKMGFPRTCFGRKGSETYASGCGRETYTRAALWYGQGEDFYYAQERESTQEHLEESRAERRGGSRALRRGRVGREEGSLRVRTG